MNNGWNPIDTAPKTPEEYIILKFDKDVWVYDNIVAIVTYDEYSGMWYDKNGFGYNKATHWMPLPDPPE